MATEFAMPAAATTFNSSPTQYTLYATQAQPISPVSSANTSPHDSSPTSPRSALSHLPAPTRQLRPMKSPLYVPAVLRPTEPPRKANRTSPVTPPQSMNSSFDNLHTAAPLTRRWTGDSAKSGLGQITEVDVSAEGLGKVTDLPTRQHWKPDNAASICDSPTCTRSFSYFHRRHHCRRCGNIFCDQHSLYAIPLDQDANYHPYGTRSRACEHCFLEYKGWEITRLSRSNSESSEDHPKTPNLSCGTNTRFGSVFAQKMGVGAENIGQSVPRDWNWSTF